MRGRPYCDLNMRCKNRAVGVLAQLGQEIPVCEECAARVGITHIITRYQEGK